MAERKNSLDAVLEGPRSHHPLTTTSNELEVALPDPPESLGDPGRELWYRLGAVLLQMRQVTEADYLALSVLCKDYETVQTGRGNLGG